MRSWSYHLLALFVVLCWGMTLVSSKVLLNFGGIRNKWLI